MTEKEKDYIISKQAETITELQERIRTMQILLRELFNHLGKSDELKERINEVLS